ncbi:MAG: hypothetical protein GY820_03000 [Gammaproteobacteria bacterium]|nr:hypothetical protein [Gammaproteobacteria bacterium]
MPRNAGNTLPWGNPRAPRDFAPRNSLDALQANLTVLNLQVSKMWRQHQIAYSEPNPLASTLIQRI